MTSAQQTKPRKGTRTLIVARMEPEEADAVAQIFSDSDATELPGMIGLSRRTLFRFHDLYFHLVEADETSRRAFTGPGATRCMATSTSGSRTISGRKTPTGGS
jgi:hypothetical protein